MTTTAKVKAIMLDEKWHRLSAVVRAVGADAATVSARIRDLRKPEYGGYTVQRGAAGYRLLSQGSLAFGEHKAHRCQFCGGKGYKTGGRCK